MAVPMRSIRRSTAFWATPSCCDPISIRFRARRFAPCSRRFTNPPPRSIIGRPGARITRSCWTAWDAGRGLTAEQIREVGAFVQFDRRRYEQQGTGLGLAIAKLLAERNGGTLATDSEPGRGTTVMVRLPLAAGRS